MHPLDMHAAVSYSPGFTSETWFPTIPTDEVEIVNPLNWYKQVALLPLKMVR